MRIALSFLVVAACGGGGQSPPDAAPPPPDAPVNLVAHRYVMDSQQLPTNNSEARELGLDLDSDAVIDNQLGMVVATLSGQGLDSQVTLTGAISRGEVLMLAELAVDSFAQGPMTFTLFSGTNPQPPACNGAGDTVCRRHLDGNATFDIAMDSARDEPLKGQLMGGIGTTEIVFGSRLQLQTTILAETPITLDLLGARAKITNASATQVSGIIGGAITQNDLDTKILPAIQQSADAVVQAECNGAPPDCACPNGTSADTFQGLFDTAPQDCAISLDEVRNNSLIQSLLAPDVMVEGQQALSLGVGFTAVGATFTP
jgi:hypothetical protein